MATLRRLRTVVAWLSGGRALSQPRRHLLSNPPMGQHNVPDEFQTELLNGQDVFELTVQRLLQHYQDKDFTIGEYTEFCLRRIHILNPFLEAVIETNPDARRIAASLDQQLSSGDLYGPLHGVPVLVKDNIATHDGMQTTAGSWALLGSQVPRDAAVVSLLRESGAVIIGHSNMSEWASCRSKQYSTGYSPRGGQVRNPYDLRKSPFGSSSGSAAAVSADLVPLSLGTETDTSIVGPASINGVVGIKPTVGLTSRAGVIPISENMDSVGTFGRTVVDAVVGLDAIVDRAMCSDRYVQLPLSQYLTTAEVLKGARFGRPMRRCWNNIPATCQKVADHFIASISTAGAEIIDVDLPSIDERVAPNGEWNWEHGDVDKREWTVAKADAYNGIKSYLQQLKTSPVRSIEDIVSYNEANSGTEGPTAGQVAAFPNGHDNLIEIMESKGRKDATYHAALHHIRKQTRENGIDAALSEVDALLFCDRRGIGQQYAAQAGYPIICIPIGLDEAGLPVSISVQHTAWSEAKLVKWASAIEDLWNKEHGWRAVPTFRNCNAKNIPIDPP